MNARGSIAIITFLVIATPCAYTHGRSQEMIDMLNAPPPEWLTIGKRIVVEPDSGGSGDSITFRPLSGGAQNTRRRAIIPDRGIEISVDYPIDWSGIMEAGRGVSLSLDGTKLIINSGTESRLYEIGTDGSHHEVEIRFPFVTYDPGPKGFITGWSWAGDNAVIGKAEITDYQGHDVLEMRIYVFHLKERMLSRLDMSALGLPDAAHFEVLGIGSDLNHLKISVDGEEFTVKADLETPPEPMNTARAGSSGPGSPERRPPASRRAHSAGEADSTGPAPAQSWMPWLVTALVAAATGMLWWLLRKRDS